jgi:exo-beta-1,3-glucanase (GH17 family)
MKIPTHIFVAIAIILGMASCNVNSPVAPVRNNAILVDGDPFEIKGICYHPVPKGSRVRDFSQLTEDLALMKEAGINTIRVYEPIAERTVLDEIGAAGLKVIISFGYNQEGKYDILSGTYLDYVNEFKDHPAILLWELGNEYNFHPEWFGGDITVWYTALNAAAKAIQKVDTNHLVSTAHGEIPDSETLDLCPDIQIWGMNVYRWDDPESLLAEWTKSHPGRPMYFAEVGADSFMAIKNAGYDKGPNEKAQADALRTILEDIDKYPEACAGVVVFAFNDEWWKSGSYDVQDESGKEGAGVPYDDVANEEWWGIVTLDRTKKEAFHLLKEQWNSFPVD